MSNRKSSTNAQNVYNVNKNMPEGFARRRMPSRKPLTQDMYETDSATVQDPVVLSQFPQSREEVHTRS